MPRPFSVQASGFFHMTATLAPYEVRLPKLDPPPPTTTPFSLSFGGGWQPSRCQAPSARRGQTHRKPESYLVCWQRESRLRFPSNRWSRSLWKRFAEPTSVCAVTRPKNNLSLFPCRWIDWRRCFVASGCFCLDAGRHCHPFTRPPGIICN